MFLTVEATTLPLDVTRNFRSKFYEMRTSVPTSAANHIRNQVSHYTILQTFPDTNRKSSHFGQWLHRTKVCVIYTRSTLTFSVSRQNQPQIAVKIKTSTQSLRSSIRKPIRLCPRQPSQPNWFIGYRWIHQILSLSTLASNSIRCFDRWYVKVWWLSMPNGNPHFFPPTKWRWFNWYVEPFLDRKNGKIIDGYVVQATRKHVFLVDVVQLDVGNEDWNQLGRQIFNNMEILKLGEFCFSISRLNAWRPKRLFVIFFFWIFVWRFFTVERLDNVSKTHSRFEPVVTVANIVFGPTRIMAQIAFDVEILLPLRR